MISLPKEKTMKYIGRFFLLIIALVILFGSLILTGLEVMAKNESIEDLRKMPIEYEKEMENGEKVCKVYKVPDSRVGPEDKRYIIKKIRDGLWINLSKTSKTRSEIHLLIADKKMFETVQLIKGDKDEDLILKTLNESIVNLKEAKKTLCNDDKEATKTLTINKKIDEAGLAYKDIVKFLNYKSEKMEKTLNDLDNWNKENN